MHHILCTIITLFITPWLVSGERSIMLREDHAPFLINSYKQLLYPGLALYNQGKMNDARARHFLLMGYRDIEKYDPDFTSLDHDFHIVVAHAISESQLSCNPLLPTHLKRAVSFAQKAQSNLTELAITFTYRGASASTNDNLKNLYNKKAFHIFEQERRTNPLAKEYYEQALCYGIGCEYNPTKALNYYTTQLKQIADYPCFTDQTMNACEALLNYMDHLAQNDDMRSQCALVKTYMKGDYHLAVSHEKALRSCEQFVLTLATLPSLQQLPLEYFIIPMTLKELSFTNKKAFLLNIFYNALYATKKDAIYNKKINEICAKLPKNSLLPSFLKLLCTDGCKDFLINLDKMKGIRLDKKEFVAFCNSKEYAITLQFLEKRLAHLTEKQQHLSDVYHYIIGLGAYHHEDYIKAYTHLIQCGGYKNDLYTQALLFTMSPLEHKLELLETIFPLLEIAQQCLHPRTRDEKAKQIIATALTTLTDGADFLMNLDTITTMTLDNKAFQKFCNSGNHAPIMAFLEQRVGKLTEKQQEIADAYHYLIGLYAYSFKDRTKSHEHLIQRAGYENDLYIQALIFTMSSFENRLELLEQIIPLAKSTQRSAHSRDRDERATQLITTKIFLEYEKDIWKFLRNQKYSHACQLTYYLTQLDPTILAACDAFLKIARCTDQENEENQCKLWQRLLYRSMIYNELEKKAQEKNHCSSVCTCLQLIAMQRAHHTWADERSRWKAKKQRVNYLSCMLTHAELPDDYKEELQSLCAQLAYEIGISYLEQAKIDVENGIKYLDIAIKHGSARACHKKAYVLACESTNPKYEKEMVTLIAMLEEQSKTNGPLKSETSTLLVELLQAKAGKTCDDKKRFFYALQHTVELGHYDYAMDLAQQYHDGIKDEKGNYFLQPDINTALDYLNLHILNAECKAQAFRMRGLLWREKDKEAYALKDTATSLVYKARALEDFEACLQYLMPPHIRAELQFYVATLTMLIDNIKGVNEQAMNHFTTANDLVTEFLKVDSDYDAYMSIILSSIDDEFLNKACETTLHILDTQDRSESALRWCAITGRFLLEKSQEKMCDEKKSVAYKKHALEIIKYAAKNHCLEAQWQLINTEGEISLAQKTCYINNLLTNAREKNKPLVPFLEQKQLELWIETEWQVIASNEISLDRRIEHAEAVLKKCGQCDYYVLPKIHEKLKELYIQRAIKIDTKDVTFIPIPPSPVAKKKEGAYGLIDQKNKELENHKLFNRLVHKPISQYMTKKYQEVCALYGSNPIKAVQLLQQLKKDNHPFAQLHLARHFFEANNELALNHFENSLRAGIIEEKNQPSRFVDTQMLNLVYGFIQDVSRYPQGSRWIASMRTILVAKKIDLGAFQQVLKDIYGFDITQNPGWQKKNTAKKK